VTTFLLGRKPDKIEIAGQDAATAETSGSHHSEAAVHIWMRISYQSGLSTSTAAAESAVSDQRGLFDLCTTATSFLLSCISLAHGAPS
jgi:hypothetical protein